MARKEIIITIDDDGRDRGKAFTIRELSAMKAERWAARALLALMHSGIDVPEDVADAGFAGIAAIGVRAFAGVDFAEAEPLMAEMLTCCQIIPDPSRPQVHRPIIEDDIEEVATLLRLREEILSLHLGFSIAGFRSTRIPPPPMPPPTVGVSLNTATSRVQ
jgi:hypothetical protein